MRLPLIFMGALLVAGCGPGGLDGLDQPTLRAQVVGTPLFLRIGASGEGCPEVSDAVTATLDGAPLHADSLGGSAGGLIGGCKGIQFSGVVPATSVDATFVVTDGDTTWTMVIPGYFAPRSLLIVSAAPELHPGSVIEARAQPESDTFEPGPGASAGFSSDDGAVAFVIKDPGAITVSGSTITFTIPAVANIPTGGAPGTLTVSPGIPLAHVDTCEGPTSCAAQLGADYAAHMTLLPP